MLFVKIFGLVVIVINVIMIDAVKEPVDVLRDMRDKPFSEYRLRGMLAGHIPRVSIEYRRIPL